MESLFEDDSDEDLETIEEKQLKRALQLSLNEKSKEELELELAIQASLQKDASQQEFKVEDILSYIAADDSHQQDYDEENEYQEAIEFSRLQQLETERRLRTCELNFPSNLFPLLSKAKYFLQRKLGVNLEFSRKNINLVKISCTDSAIADVVKSELANIFDDPQTLQTELDILQRELVHVFVDESNIIVGAQTLKNEDNTTTRDISVRVKPSCLAGIVINYRQAIQQVVFGSKTHEAKNPVLWQKWKDIGFDVHGELRTAGSGETFVDDAIVAMINAAVLRFPYREGSPRRTLLLLTGDGNLNAGRASFIESVDCALRSGWKVEMWCWRQSINQNYVQMLNQYADSGLFYVNYLDEYRDVITFREERYTNGKGNPMQNTTNSSSNNSTNRNNNKKRNYPQENQNHHHPNKNNKKQHTPHSGVIQQHNQNYNQHNSKQKATKHEK